MMLAAMSQRTKRIRLGFGVVVMPCHHPFHVAERVSTLDILSEGRAEFGLGVERREYITEGFGVSAEDARAYADESVEAVMSMFEHETFPGQGGNSLTCRREGRATASPSAASTALDRRIKPRIVGPSSKRGLGVIGVTRLPPEEAKPAVKRRIGAKSKQAIPTIGMANTSIRVLALLQLPAVTTTMWSEERSQRCARWYYGQNDAELNRLRFGSAAGIKGVLATVKDRTDQELIDDAMVVGGDADTCSRVIERWASIGLDQIVLMMQAGHTTHDQVMRSIELIGERVIPRFQ